LSVTDLAAAGVLALDLGGTQIRAACVRPGGEIVAPRRSRTPVVDGGEAIVAACIAALRGVRDDLGRFSQPPPVGVGISAPGPVDPRLGMILDPPNLGLTFHDIPLAARIEEALGLPVALDRDTQVAALAEGRFGAAAGCDDFLYLTVSTGVGGAIVSGGRLLRGPDGTCTAPDADAGCPATWRPSRREAASRGEPGRPPTAARAVCWLTWFASAERRSGRGTWQARKMPATLSRPGSWTTGARHSRLPA
jgi:hypothetical protein